jgi:hypothetical protein
LELRERNWREAGEDALPKIVRIIKSRNVRLKRQEAHGEIRNVCKILDRKSEEKRPLGRDMLGECRLDASRSG